MSEERMTNASGQFLVRWTSENRETLCRRLETFGYKGSCNDGSGRYAGVNVFCVDKRKHIYMQVSASTCAAWRQAGITIHSAEDIENML